MRAIIMTAAACAAAFATVACAPEFNWRDIPVGPGALTALFPCKPETGTRTAPMAGGDVELRMRHCETGGLTAAVGQATLRAGQAPGPVLDQWRLATLASLRANQSRETPWAMAGAAPLLQSRRVEAAGLDAQGRPLQLRAVWFSQGAEVYAALLYGPSIRAEVADTFFGGLRLR